jgi:hypothetical protein
MDWRFSNLLCSKGCFGTHDTAGLQSAHLDACMPQFADDLPVRNNAAACFRPLSQTWRAGAGPVLVAHCCEGGSKCQADAV